jgi:hypothetical protein
LQGVAIFGSKGASRKEAEAAAVEALKNRHQMNKTEARKEQAEALARDKAALSERTKDGYFQAKNWKEWHERNETKEKLEAKAQEALAALKPHEIDRAANRGRLGEEEREHLTDKRAEFLQKMAKIEEELAQKRAAEEKEREDELEQDRERERERERDLGDDWER